MRITAIWVIDLPLTFHTGNRFKNTTLNIFNFRIDDIDIEFVKDKGEIKKVKLKLHHEYDDDYLPSYKHIEYLSSFSDFITIKAGKTIQSFLDGFSKYSDDEYHQIFDGEDFITNYKLTIEPNILSGSGSDNKRCYYLDDEILIKAIEFASKDKSVFDNVWYLLRDAEHNMELGKYEISLINMAISIELLVTYSLRHILGNKGIFDNTHKQKIVAIYGRGASFVDKYFRYGIPLVTDSVLEEDILGSIDFIYKLRNKLAHGKNFYDIKIVRENNIDEYNVRAIWFDLLSVSTDVYNYFIDINSKIKD